MAKRLTDSAKWDRPWFRRLKPLQKTFWQYIVDKCDHAGVWNVDFETAEYFINEKIDPEDMLKAMSKQILILDESRWFIIDFIPFQYKCEIGELNSKNKLHAGVLKILDSLKIVEKLNLRATPSKPLESPKQAHKEKEKEKDKENNIESNIKKNLNIIDQLLENFAGKYQELRGPEYIVQEKDKKAIGLLLKIYKKKNPSSDSKKCIADFETTFVQCLNITEDNFLYKNMSPAMIYSQINKIKLILSRRNGNANSTNHAIASGIASMFNIPAN